MQAVAHSYHILLSSEMRQAASTCSNIGEPQSYMLLAKPTLKATE